MKTNVLLLTIAITTLACSGFASEALLTPRAQGNQPKSAPAAAPAVIVSYVAPASATLLTPRAAGNQLRTVSGIATDVNPILACRSTMPGSPRIVTECTQQTTMPWCQKLASLK